jgi:hypothetical protein
MEFLIIPILIRNFMSFPRKCCSIGQELYAVYVKKYRLEGKTEFEAQWYALESIKENTDIVFKEVDVDE